LAGSFLWWRPKVGDGANQQGGELQARLATLERLLAEQRGG
jgi:hypothetical protein